MSDYRWVLFKCIGDKKCTDQCIREVMVENNVSVPRTVYCRFAKTKKTFRATPTSNELKVTK